ncbi:hypothetical protein IUY40_12425 [Flavobacterium sp. ALJ2]|uniref:KAP family P-loop NTPase fold protein n=1 Tax=Flavobacterium sp. ALJ2 TaxID=2786960 RepID=UPI00189C6A7B|nr:P-loop NTPase fold protein [Flavobacterium sp. ALJ2]MBF7092343.1 hypothetical protein [Flavobacterium sp. ALJ2]
MSDNIHFLSDSAINNSEEDLFNFKHYADKVKKLIQLNSSNSEAITIGIYGKWGEGKTSFLNLIDNKIEHFDKKDGDKEYLKWHFNPWRYSNEEEMMFDFFDSLSKKFYANEKTNLQEVGKWISKYSKYLKAIKISTTVGIPKVFNSKVVFNVDEIFKALGEDLQGEAITLEVLKDRVNDAIKKVNFKVIIFIDDLDRLDKDEIYTILKLIKLNANFNNFIFIVNLDIDHVSKAIKDRYGDNEEDGKMFLEKIINIPIHLPKIEDADLKEFFIKKLSQVRTNLGLNKSENDEVFNEIIMEFSSNFFSSPREIIRVLNSFFLGAFAIGDEVHLRDLFWVEYLKIKNGDCYNFIKDYQHKRVFQEFDKTLDFNDNYDSEEKPNGNRKYLIEKFTNVAFVVNSLFPTYYSNGITILGGKPNLDLLDKQSRINHIGHYEKYFSFHNVRKTSVLKLNAVEKLIEQRNSDSLILLLKNLFLDERQHYKILYRIELIIKELASKDERNFFYSFLLNNFDIIPDSKNDMNGLDYRIKLIELMASTLDKDQINDNSKISLSLAENLDVYQLSHFTRKFNEDKSFKDSLKQFIYIKAKTTFNVDNPIYKNPYNVSNKMIMFYWKLGNKEEFNNHINSTIINEENIKLLIRNFPSFWDNSYFGPLEQDNFEYLKTIIDIDFIFQKIREFNPDLVKRINHNDYEFPDDEANTEEQNLEQFIYWYKKEKENENLLLLL